MKCDESYEKLSNAAFFGILRRAPRIIAAPQAAAVRTGGGGASPNSPDMSTARTAKAAICRSGGKGHDPHALFKPVRRIHSKRMRT